MLKYGMEGYGLYWYCLECVARNVEKHNLTFELEEDAELIAADTGIHYERVEEMMRYMISLRLFEASEGRVTCLKMASRADEYTQKLLKNREQYQQLAERPDDVPTESGEGRDKVRSNRIEENRTEQIDKKRKKTVRRFTPPTREEVKDYCRERNNKVDPERWFDYYLSNGWKVGKTNMKDWKAAVRTWERNNFGQASRPDIGSSGTSGRFRDDDIR